MGSLLKMLGTKLKMSSAYHPKTYAQIEITDHTLEDMLKHYVLGYKQVTWKKHLFLMEFAYNVNWYSSIKTNLFYALYGQECFNSPFYFNTHL